MMFLSRSGFFRRVR